MGRTGWGIFMILYGMFVISIVDNIIKPIIISRGSKLSFIVMLIGVLGGVTAFGVIGIFLGPTLLAVGFSLAQEILEQRRTLGVLLENFGASSVAAPKVCRRNRRSICGARCADVRRRSANPHAASNSSWRRRPEGAVEGRCRSEPVYFVDRGG
jgi:hypothetical protein